MSCAAVHGTQISLLHVTTKKHPNVATRSWCREQWFQEDPLAHSGHCFNCFGCSYRPQTWCRIAGIWYRQVLQIHPCPRDCFNLGCNDYNRISENRFLVMMALICILRMNMYILCCLWLHHYNPPTFTKCFSIVEKWPPRSARDTFAMALYLKMWHYMRNNYDETVCKTKQFFGAISKCVLSCFVRRYSAVKASF